MFPIIIDSILIDSIVFDTIMHYFYFTITNQNGKNRQQRQ
jgi:hypothetical protein